MAADGPAKLRLSLLALAAVLCGGPLWAQGQMTAVTIMTSLAGPVFAVDGQQYNGPQIFLWPAGSKHVVQFIGGPMPASLIAPGAGTYVQLTASQDTIYSFAGWQENTGLLQNLGTPVITVTADPNVTKIVANVTVLYLLKLYFPTGAPANTPPVCGGAPGDIPSNVYVPGLIYIGGTCFWGSTNVYFPAGLVNINVFPFPGFVFGGWYQNQTSSNQYLTSLNITGPTTLYPYFENAKRVRFITSPLGFPVIVDHEQVPTMPNPNSTGACPTGTSLPVDAPATIAPMCIGDFDFAPGSTHQVSAPSPYFDSRHNAWVFSGWSGTNAIQNGVYVTDTHTNLRDTVTANFTPAGEVNLHTNPPGLSLSVDGGSGQSFYSYYWALGSTHQFSAPQQQTGPDTRTYVLQGWSNGGAASQSLTVDQTLVNTGITLTANYQAMGRLVVQSVPSGLSLQVDGQPCQTPCQVDHPSGTAVPVTAPPSISSGANSRYDFLSWSDGGAGTHSVTLSNAVITLVANYQTKYRLVASSSPASAATFSFSPASADAFFPQGATVAVNEKDVAGYRFLEWNGALSGTWPTGSVVMTSPLSVVAIMEKVPYISPAGVQNAAGLTPDDAVAPGSVISIFGSSLATQTGQSQASPLPQSLAGTSVDVDGRLLVLSYVSPTQINAVLPPDLPDGDHTINVTITGLPPVSGNFTAIRNAPGLFVSWVNGKAFAAASHSDGSVVNQANPAKKGETITLLGTGFGPCQTNPVYGFNVPTSPANPLLDVVTITLGSLPGTPATAVCAPGRQGFDSLQFAIPQDAPAAVSLPLVLAINGHTSNTVLLPLQ